MTNNERREARYQRRKMARELHKQKLTEPYDNFDKVFTYDNLFDAYRKCSKGVKWKGSIQRFLAIRALNTYRMLQRIKEGTFEPDPFYEFDLMERGKLRHIRSNTIRERGVQRCLCDNALTYLISRSFIYDNGASLKDKGYTFQQNRAKAHLHKFYHYYGTNEGYVLTFDFSKFFDSINHELCYKIINESIKDERLRVISRQFIGAFEGERGLGLGSQISQILALAAGNELDHFIKEKLHIKYYGRYMDDGYLIHPDKKYLQYCLKEIKKKCDELGLVLNRKKTIIIKISRGFTFLKTRFYLLSSGKVIKKIYKKSVTKQRRKLKKLKKRMEQNILSIDDIYQSFQSWRSYAYNFDAYRTINNMEKLYFELFEDLGGHSI